MDVRIEISDCRVSCRQNGRVAFSTSLYEFLAALKEWANDQPFPHVLPEGTRFVRRRRDVVVLALEEKPMRRTVKWLAEESTGRFGRKASYRTVRLAFPFVVVVVALRNGALTGYNQLFYRVAPLADTRDLLFCPNLYNVAAAYDLPCWLCLANLRENLTSLPWDEKARTIWSHVFGAGFNASSEYNEGNSYWMTSGQIDPRLATVSAWEEASHKDPFFPLAVRWRPVGQTIGEVMEHMLSVCAPPHFPSDTATLAQVVNAAVLRARAR